MLDSGRGAGIPFVGVIRRRPVVALIVAGLLVGVGIVMLVNAALVYDLNWTESQIKDREARRTMLLAWIPMGLAGLVVAPLQKAAGALLFVAVPIAVIRDSSGTADSGVPPVLILFAFVLVMVSMIRRRRRGQR